MAVSRRSGSATGKKLFYIALDGRLMAVAIRIASTCPSPKYTPASGICITAPSRSLSTAPNFTG